MTLKYKEKRELLLLGYIAQGSQTTAGCISCSLLTVCCCDKICDKSWQSNCHMRPLSFSTITIILSRTGCLDFVGLVDLVKRLKNIAEGHQLDSWLQN